MSALPIEILEIIFQHVASFQYQAAPPLRACAKVSKACQLPTDSIYLHTIRINLKPGLLLHCISQGTIGTFVKTYLKIIITNSVRKKLTQSLCYLLNLKRIYVEKSDY